ncbi:MAG: methyl-accepting chemotaxis protein [Myxococcales bacterium]|nr:methyl-accepting chemotaxis protein [Myxococcales bacterium]MCB9731853.1 methyl-accepting chemotaxis protein [Deltaproteobacteria bacterium]
MEECLRWLEERVETRIDDATTRSEQGVLEAGSAVEAILAEARAHVNETQATLNDLTAAGSSDSVFEAVNDQARCVSQYVQKLQTATRDQAAAASAAIAQVDEMHALAHAMEQVASETRIVAINARIEASRLGPQGKPMIIIAEEMSRLNQHVQSMNKAVEALTNELCVVLPRIEALGLGMRAQAEEFETTLTEGLGDVARGADAFRRGVENVLAAGDRRLSSILEKAYAALSHLQFQDPVRQDLALFEGEVRAVTDNIRESVRTGEPCQKPPGDLAHRRRHNRGLAGEEHVVTDDGDTITAGEVLLF